MLCSAAQQELAAKTERLEILCGRQQREEMQGHEKVRLKVRRWRDWSGEWEQESSEEAR